VGSTTLNRKLGNRIWNEALGQHENTVQDLTSQFDCREIKGTGDGFMIVFRTAMEALDFALGLHANTGHNDIRIRAGIHVGAVRIKENDIQGGMVNLTARIVGWRTRVRSMPEMQDLIVLSDTAKEHIDEELGINSSQARFLPYEAELKDFGKRKLWVAITPEMKQRYEAKRKTQSVPSSTLSNRVAEPQHSDVAKGSQPLRTFYNISAKQEPLLKRRPIIEEVLKRPPDKK
jgi:hypothetical protein